MLFASGRGVEKDEKKGFELTSKAASKCHARAEYNLATMYYHGICFGPNSVKAEVKC
jgi:TPR repeat protein